jgi:hypothetical protein
VEGEGYLMVVLMGGRRRDQSWRVEEDRWLEGKEGERGGGRWLVAGSVQ